MHTKFEGCGGPKLDRPTTDDTSLVPEHDADLQAVAGQPAGSRNLEFDPAIQTK
jgi:hypothetical protein